jgi:hypothetical protein
MSPTAAAESTVAESTATETMLDAISRMETAAVKAARMVITGIAVIAARRAVTSAASQNEEGGHRKKRVERPLPLAELRRWFAGFRDGLVVDELMLFHG